MEKVTIKTQLKKNFPLLVCVIIVFALLGLARIFPATQFFVLPIMLSVLFIPVVVVYIETTKVKNRVIAIILKAIFGWVLPAALALSIIASILMAMPLEHPYKATIPGETFSLNEEWIQMKKNTPEHFTMVTVNTQQVVSNRYQEISLLIQGGGFIERNFTLPDMKAQELEKRTDEFSTAEGISKPIIAALKQSGVSPSYEEKAIAITKVDLESFFHNNDVIVAINNYTDPADIEFAWNDFTINKGKNLDIPNGLVSLTVLRDGKKLEPFIIPLNEFLDKFQISSLNVRSTVNILNQNIADPIKIVAGEIGGDSASLSKSLEIYQRLNQVDLLKGRKIVTTGGIQTNGKVTGIASIYYKYVTLIQDGADLFIAPEFHRNEMEYYFKQGKLPRKIPVIYVSSLEEAIEKLKQS